MCIFVDWAYTILQGWGIDSLSFYTRFDLYFDFKLEIGCHCSEPPIFVFQKLISVLLTFWRLSLILY
jgi:hypothetical protein